MLIIKAKQTFSFMFFIITSMICCIWCIIRVRPMINLYKNEIAFYDNLQL